jgi:hypothetical protein
MRLDNARTLECPAVHYFGTMTWNPFCIFVMDSEVIICYSQKREIKLPVSATHTPLNDDSNSTTLDNYLQQTAAATPTTSGKISYYFVTEGLLVR